MLVWPLRDHGFAQEVLEVVLSLARPKELAQILSGQQQGARPESLFH